MRILIIDNYDSFTYNLYQYIGEAVEQYANRETRGTFDIKVVRNDERSLDEIKQLSPDRILISPGPGSPEDKSYFGVCAQVIEDMGRTVPTLGVCLGMQGIAHVFGGKVIKAGVPMHGKVSPVSHDAQGVFANIPQGLEIMRYHSLMVEKASLPDCLQMSAVITQGGRFIEDMNDPSMEIMGIRHKEFPIQGIQFHPESFGTEGGREILSNFIFPNRL